MAWLRAWHRSLPEPRLCPPSRTIFILCLLLATCWQCACAALPGCIPVCRAERQNPPPSWKQTQRHIPNAGAWAEKPVPLQGRAHAEQHEVTVSATETRVSDDRSVMIYSENSPIKNTLEDPAYCLVPFKHSTAKAVQFAG